RGGLPKCDQRSEARAVTASAVMNAHYTRSADHYCGFSSAAPLFPGRIVLIVIGLPVTSCSLLAFTYPP
ncbi:hypothetical protein KMS84_39470, partial [Streptomyces sp. IBSBF 2807]|nr:hypothetical protein [Streptomyces hilarionis]